MKDINQTTCELDPCSSKLVYKCLDVLKGTLTKLVKLSLRQGLFIHNSKLAIAKPLIKNINLGTKLKNYRPISNLSLVSKYVEKLVQNELTYHFNMQSLIPNHYNAYRKFFSTETIILDPCDNILINMENNENKAMVALHLSAAFDTVNHKLLMKVLKNYFGIWEKASNWIISYLQNRQFQVHIDGISSEKMTINYSVQQGSILGPLFFNCYSCTIQEIKPPNMSGNADDHFLLNNSNQATPQSKKIWKVK